MTVLYWTRQTRKRDDAGGWADSDRRTATKVHVSPDGATTACGSLVPAEATILGVTADWHEHTNCYNCAYRLWPEHAPPGYVRPDNGEDFPPRRECPQHPGRGHDARSCPSHTELRTDSPPADRSRRRPRPAGQDVGNPDPDRIRRWRIPNPYEVAYCVACGEALTVGELISIEYELGVMHARCCS
ncbi:MAG: hypothetical protein AB7N73_12365 [Gemmatimonadales bacterium]|jgi:hypothetical protein